MKNLFLLFLIIINLGCNPDSADKNFLTLINNSDIDVYFYNSESFQIGHFPDTILPLQRPPGLQPIITNGRSSKYDNPNWDQIFSELPENKFSVYIFSKELVDNTDWSIVRENNLILVRLDLSRSDLESTNFTIKYSN